VIISFAFTATVSDDVFGYIVAGFFVAYHLSDSASGLIIDKLGARPGY
jgi:hypothetical protein